MRRSQGQTSQEERQIDCSETLRSIFGKLEEHEDNGYLKDPVYRKFGKKVGEIQSIAENSLCPIGGCLLMINANYGYTWDTIPWGRFDEIKEFVRNNTKDRYKLIDPEFHKKLVECGYYQMSPTRMANKNLVASWANKVGKMMEEHQPAVNFEILARSIQNIKD
jgi:hypothetical protein